LPLLPQIAMTAHGLFITAMPLPIQPSHSAMPGRAEMVKVFEPLPDTGPRIAV